MRKAEAQRWLHRTRLRVDRLSLTARFGLVSAIMVCLLGLALALTLSNIVENRARDEAERAGELLVAVAVEPAFQDRRQGRWLHPEARATIDAEVRMGIEHRSLLRIKVFDADGTLVYSDDPALVGEVYEISEALATALAGKVTSKFADTTDDRHAAERGLGRLLEIFVPLHDDQSGNPTGVAELYLAYDPVAEAVAHDIRRLMLLLAAGLGVLWISLFRLVHRASRRLRAEVERNEHEALHDALTGLPNRVATGRRLEELRKDRRSGGEVAVLWLDLDGLKAINDSLGHSAGDEVLRVVAARLQESVRKQDHVARFGGDEFVVICPDVSLEDAVAVAERILEALRRPLLLDTGRHVVTTSVGVAVSGTMSADDLLAAADVAMYAAKERGRNQMAIFDDTMRTDSINRLQLTADLRGAVERGELRLHYQPYVDVRTDQVVGVEALLRWEHPTRGLLTPQAFLEIAEDSGAIVPIGHWVLKEACRTLSGWQRTSHLSSLHMSVNLAAREFTDADIVAAVTAALADAGAHPAGLTIEITETSVMANVDAAIDAMHRLRRAGVCIAIDDFGTGYSSLAYLKRFPVQQLKVDKSFVDDLGENPREAALISAVPSLARAMGLSVVAEGIETTRQLALLRTLGCDLGQGYLWQTPLPRERLEAWLAERARSEWAPSHQTVALARTARMSRVPWNFGGGPSEHQAALTF
ncbi:MAG: putative bifunctional diguanylate cyclase/phosphodiesterase [Nocardioidaceae bacterium]